MFVSDIKLESRESDKSDLGAVILGEENGDKTRLGVDVLEEICGEETEISDSFGRDSRCVDGDVDLGFCYYSIVRVTLHFNVLKGISRCLCCITLCGRWYHKGKDNDIDCDDEKYCD